MRKKIIISAFVLFTLFSFAFSEEALKQGDRDPDFFTMRAGGYFDYGAIVGDLRTYAKDNIGGGITYEWGFKLPVFNLSIGPAFHATFDGAVPNSDKIISFMDLSFTASAFLRIPIDFAGVFELVIAPEIGYGIMLGFPKANPAYFNANEVSGCYCDQVLFVAVGIKYAPPMILDGKLEFDLTPIYQFCPESNNLGAHGIGFRAGATYRVK